MLWGKTQATVKPGTGDDLPRGLFTPDRDTGWSYKDQREINYWAGLSGLILGVWIIDELQNRMQGEGFCLLDSVSHIHLIVWWDVWDNTMWPGHMRQLRRGLSGQKDPICLINPALFQPARFLFRLIRWPGLFFQWHDMYKWVDSDFVVPSILCSDVVNWWPAQSSFSSAASKGCIDTIFPHVTERLIVVRGENYL